MTWRAWRVSRLPTIVRFGNPDTSSAAGLPFPTGNTDTSIYKFGSVKGSDACFVFLDGHAHLAGV